MPSPQNRWRSIRPVPEYLQIFFDAGWEEQHQPPIGIGHHNQTIINMTLNVEALDDGRTAVKVEYKTVINNLAQHDSVATDLIRYTNQRIRNLCWNYPVE